MIRRLCLFIIICTFVTATANVIKIPLNYATIQEGIDNANEGDTILVSSGIYFEQLFRQQVRYYFGLDPLPDGGAPDGDVEAATEAVWAMCLERYEAKEQKVGAELMRQYERHILLQIIDGAWKDHLLAMDHMKDGIGLRAYGQPDPLVEYKKESFDMFGQMKERIENDAVRFLFLLEPMTEDERRREEERRRREQEAVFVAASRSAAGVTARGGDETVVRKNAKVGRNDPCPCGSGQSSSAATARERVV